MRLSNKIDYTGFFWLPNLRDDKFPGTLRISESGKAQLEVLGFIGKSIIDFDSLDGSYRICGILENGKSITLEKCFIIGRHFSSGGVVKATFHAHFVFLGIEYEVDEPIMFSSFVFTIEGLDEWLSVINLETEYDERTKGGVIKYQHIEPIIVHLIDDVSLEIWSPWASSFSYTEATIKNKPQIRIVSKQLRPLEYYLKLLHHINMFFCLATDYPVMISSITSYSNEFKLEISNTKEVELDIEIYYESTYSSESVRKLFQHEMLFSFKDVSSIQDSLNAWLKAYEDYESSFDSYFATIYDSYNFLDDKFLTLTQCVESYQRQKYNELAMPEEEFSNILSNLIDACPEHRRDWLQRRLEYTNTPSLGARVKRMIHPFKKYFGNSEKRDMFIRKVVHTRNYRTHLVPELKNEALTGKELWIALVKIDCLFKFHLLLEAGFSQDEIDRMVRENIKIKQYVSRGFLET